MDHTEAIELMATERYLLGELTPEQRDAFEAHFFECYECALDVRAEAAMLQEMKVQLPPMAKPAAQIPDAVLAPKPEPKERRDWFAWIRPSWAVPAFAALLLVMGYQNLATIPGLRSAAESPRVAPWSAMHIGTRAGAQMPLTADRKAGAVLLIDDVPNDGIYASFAFELADPQGKLFWSQTVKAPAAGDSAISLAIPGGGLQTGAYTLTIAGITPEGSRTQLDRRVLDVRFDE
ncbi:MAG: anti-sigma factor family protein [Acidobacteriota bacterium]